LFNFDPLSVPHSSLFLSLSFPLSPLSRFPSLSSPLYKGGKGKREGE